MDETITITLKKLIEDKSLKQEWAEITLQEPNLLQVEQYFEKEKKAKDAGRNAIEAIRFLIHLVSGVSETALKTMTLTDYRKCEAWLKGFFTEPVDLGNGKS